ncbi:NAD(P)/FAD-dependent oxidoreductase [Leeia oryzae]|uniref:FAD-dependent oxidoreductase n=1 Tax=Leeia oryzae TaxID=356662 RepID=UPI0003682F0D|nr:NAD(P)/FAD-dependent oxidoreductase [Leeia oryzae]
MDRRQFLLLGATAAGVSACHAFPGLEIPVRVDMPGMALGHQLRDAHAWPAATEHRDVDTLILGSGVAGLTAAWQLQKHDYRNYLLLSGPEPLGNTAYGDAGRGLRYPKGAHYLPFPTRSSTHVRELLADMGVLVSGEHESHPYYDEAAILHAPDERIWADGKWSPGVIAPVAAHSESARQQARFFRWVEQLKTQKGSDGLRLFDIPLVLSSQDDDWRRLDMMPFSRWLDQQGYTDSALRAYLDYACRDDYGAGCTHVSAWAGLHYFACRDGHASNGADGGLLTWPEGLGRLTQWMYNRLPAANVMAGSAIRIQEGQHNVTVDVLAGKTRMTIAARRVICAMPLHVLKHLVSLSDYGFDVPQQMPPHAPWLVTNLVLQGFPPEKDGEPLAWDNVRAGSDGLGYVVATHQWIREAMPERTVFTAYRNLPQFSPDAARKWLLAAKPADLFDAAMVDLDEVYGRPRLWRHAQYAEITVRGHAMATPAVGFLHNAGLAALRKQDGRLLFAHSDLSGLSLFEEASWWGYQAAQKILG